jgi:hypothetical protein
MLVDCDRCSARALRCDNCVVGLLLGPPDGRLQLATFGAPPASAGVSAATLTDGPVVHVDPRTARPGDFDTAERRALTALAGAGLIQPLGLAADGKGVTNGVYTLTQRHSLAG